MTARWCQSWIKCICGRGWVERHWRGGGFRSMQGAAGHPSCIHTKPKTGVGMMWMALVEKTDVPCSAGVAAAGAEWVEEGVVDLIWWPCSAGDLGGERLLLTSEPY